MSIADYAELCDKVKAIDIEAYNYMVSDAQELESFEFFGELNAAFVWEKTPQGREYWDSIYWKINGFVITTKPTIRDFNLKFNLEVKDIPELPHDWVNRLDNFTLIMEEEISENVDIIEDSVDEIDALVNIADWLADMRYYIESESLKYGIPLDEVMQIVCESNMSKLDENGNVIKDDRGKVLKGQNYWKPEPKIRELLLERMIK